MLIVKKRLEFPDISRNVQCYSYYMIVEWKQLIVCWIVTIVLSLNTERKHSAACVVA